MGSKLLIPKLLILYELKSFSTHKRPRSAPFVASSKWKRYMKNPRQFEDDSMAASSVGKFKFFDSKKLDAANARRNTKHIK